MTEKPSQTPIPSPGWTFLALTDRVVLGVVDDMADILEAMQTAGKVISM